MAQNTRARSVKTNRKNTRSLRSKPKLNKRIMLLLVAIVAGVGAYVLFFAQAAVPANCVQVPGAADGQGICTMTQASKEDDGLVSNFSETDPLGAQGWYNMGPIFKAPNYPKNGALPVYRFYRADITAHFEFIQGSPEYNEAVNDAHYQYQGLSFYAWPDAREPGTVPIERIDRAALYFATLYFSERAWPDSIVRGNSTWSYHDGQNGSSHFYAYPTSYLVPPAAGAAHKDTKCDTTELIPGDVGNCVTTLKANLRGFGNGNVKFKDENSNVFDSDVDSYVTFFTVLQRNAGLTVDQYSGKVTKSIWDAIEKKPTPPKPIATTAPNCALATNQGLEVCKAEQAKKAAAATAAQSTVKASNTTPKNTVATTTAAKAVANNPCVGPKEVIFISDAEGKSKPSLCINLYQSYAGVPQTGKWEPGLHVALVTAYNANNAASAKAGPPNIDTKLGVTKSGSGSTTHSAGPNIDTKLGIETRLANIITSLPSDLSRSGWHVVAYVYNGKNVGRDFASANGWKNWDMTIECDVFTYPTVGKNGVYIYAHPESAKEKGGGEGDSCSYKNAKKSGSTGVGTGGSGDAHITQELRGSPASRNIVHWIGPNTAGVN